MYKYIWNFKSILVSEQVKPKIGFGNPAKGGRPAKENSIAGWGSKEEEEKYQNVSLRDDVIMHADEIVQIDTSTI
jgi:hypothetical protein